MHLKSIALLATLTASTAFAQDTSTARYQTPQGELTVHSGPATTRDYGAPPPFEQLDTRRAGSLSPAEADAYPPLANDFIHADANRDGHVSRAEYERWASHQ